MVPKDVVAPRAVLMKGVHLSVFLSSQPVCRALTVRYGNFADSGTFAGHNNAYAIMHLHTSWPFVSLDPKHSGRTRRLGI